MISTYSFALSIILFNLALVLVFLLRRKRYFIARYGIQVLILIVALGIIRLFSPVDGQFPHVIRSHKVIPAIRSALGYGIFGNQITVGKILLAVWLGGTAVFLIRDVCLILRFKWQRAGYTECNNAQVRAIAKELGITKPLVITPCVPMPHVAGHFRQVIYVPPLELSEEDWKYVLQHEIQHIAAHDQQIKLFFLFLRSLFWWNPVSQLFIKELDAILELRCDDQVCAKLSEDEQVSYFGAMR
ncbi:MAG: M56 family metallopeptidase [Ruminococcaceae bacterium]|nr:M56 family metallopeptidase [Oscillospiraceae bacterium]